MMISLTACAQKSPSSGEKFFIFLNAYQKDSLQNLLTDDFVLKRTFTHYQNDKQSFLENYLTFSKALNGKYLLLNVINESEPQQFLVEDRSDYLKYLKVDYPTWKITISTEHNKIKLVIIDTTAVYQKYLSEIKIADKKFKAWLIANYPEETQENLYNQEGLLNKRLKEYARMQK